MTTMTIIVRIQNGILRRGFTAAPNDSSSGETGAFAGPFIGFAAGSTGRFSRSSCMLSLLTDTDVIVWTNIAMG